MAFIATNLDDLFLLVAWFAAGRYRTRDIVLGQYAGIGALFAAGAAAGLLALLVPAAELRWLGVVPIALGLRTLFAPRTDDAPPPPAAGILAVATLTVANGADNLGVYVPLFATSSGPGLAVIAAVFAAMTGLWCLAARWLVLHPEAGARLRRHGPQAVPYVLIGVGLWILLR